MKATHIPSNPRIGKLGMPNEDDDGDDDLKSNQGSLEVRHSYPMGYGSVKGISTTIKGIQVQQEYLIYLKKFRICLKNKSGIN